MLAINIKNGIVLTEKNITGSILWIELPWPQYNSST